MAASDMMLLVILCMHCPLFNSAAFEYKACDPSNLCDTAKVDVIVGPVIDLVFAKDDRAETTSDQPIKIDVTKNDLVRVDHPLIITDVKGGRHGTCVITSDNQVEYTAAVGFQGRDRCVYTACVDENYCDEGWAYIKVLLPLETSRPPTESPTSTPMDFIVDFQSNKLDPIASSDVVTIREYEVAYIDVLGNDVDPKGAKMTITEVTEPQNGDVVVVNGGESLEYIPDEGFYGVDSELLVLTSLSYCVLSFSLTYHLSLSPIFYHNSFSIHSM